MPYVSSKPGRKILIGDNLSSHFSEKVLKTCGELNISFVCLPPKSTHLLQPLDVGFFAPLKKYWREILNYWKMREGKAQKTLAKSTFPKLLLKLESKLTEKGAHTNNLIAGFKQTGLFPINPELPKARLPKNTPNEDLVYAATSSVLTELLEDIRSPKNQLAKTKRKKKCQVSPGKSIQANDIVQINNNTEKVKIRKKTKTLKKGNLPIGNLDFSEPIAGPSGLCRNNTFTSSRYDSDDSDLKLQPIQNSAYITTTEIPYTGKGKGVGKKSKPCQKKEVLVLSKKNINNADNNLEELDIDIFEKLCNDTTVAKFIKTRKVRKSKDSSTSVSDSNMSLHSDSDFDFNMIGEISFDEDNEIYTTVTSPCLKPQAINKKLSDIEIIDEINADENENSLNGCLHNKDNLENDQNQQNTNNPVMDPLHDKCFDRHIINLRLPYSVNDYVLVRYYHRKKWLYYIGSVEYIKQSTKSYALYGIVFFKTIKKPRLAFCKPKRTDRDEVYDLSIMKKVNLKKSEDPLKYLLADEDDKIYF